MHVLDADGAAVGVAQDAEHFAQERGAAAGESADDELAVEVPEGQAVARDVEVGVAALDVLERVDVGHEVPARAERLDQLLHARRLRDALREVDRDVFAQWIGSYGMRSDAKMPS